MTQLRRGEEPLEYILRRNTIVAVDAAPKENCETNIASPKAVSILAELLRGGLTLIYRMGRKTTRAFEPFFVASSLE
jgi:hypothetical protein